MAVALETVVQQLEESGIVAQGKLEDFVPPKAHPKDVQELVRELVKQSHLTKFQAQQIAAGRTKALILGGYTILDKIGAGGMGQVFKAEHRRMKRVVAIKTLPPSTMRDPGVVARFQREVEAAAKLRHPNIVAADDADEANGVHFLVMEFVNGQDLSAIVKKQGSLPVAKAVNTILQAARGLEFAHRKGVVHRDIKPSNLLLDSEGTVKILDMGLARIASEGNAATQAELTGTGAVMGTVDYMSPEQALSTKHADGRADIYSLGCSLYYLLTGQPTYDGETITAKLMAHQAQPIPDLRKARPEVTAELVAIFEKMMAKKVEDRYQTMGEVIAALERCEGGQSTSVSVAPSASTSVENSVLSFLDHQPASPTLAPKPKEKTAPLAPKPKLKTGRAGARNKKLILYGSVGAAVVGVAIIGAIIVSLQTSEGTLTVEVNQPDAVVMVLDAEGTVEVKEKSGSGKVSIGVDPGKHRLKVEKDGFAIFGQDFEIASGGKKTITAKLEPVKMVGAEPNQAAKDAPFVNTLGMKFVLIPAGKFTMGSPDREFGHNANEAQVEVTLTKPFYLGTTTVTQEQWKQLMKTEPWKGKENVKEGGNYPATYANWDDAQEFCKALSTMEGKKYRLPTEVEWEYACRAGAKTAYCFGDDASRLGEYAWFETNAKNIGEWYAHEVGKKKSNAYGLYDMHGNVWQWCEDSYAEKLEGGRDPLVSVRGSDCVFRGGSWDNNAVNCRSAYRFKSTPADGGYGLGFRCVLAPAITTASTGEVLPFAGHRYQLVMDRSNWQEAKAKAEAMGGHLATFTSDAEELWVRDHLVAPLGKSNRSFWIGGFAAEHSREIHWVTGEPFGKLRWRGGNPGWREMESNPEAKKNGILFAAGITVGEIANNGDWAFISPVTYHEVGFIVEWDDQGVPTASATTTAPPPAEPWKDALRDPAKLVLNGGVERTPEGLRFSKQGTATYHGEEGTQHDGAARMRATFGGLRPQLLARGSKAAGNYQLFANSHLVQMARYSDVTKQWTTLRDFPLPTALQPGQTYELELRAVGQTLTAKFNGDVLGTVTDATFSDGNFSVGVADHDMAPVLVKAFDVLDLDAPGGTPATAYPQPPTWTDATVQLRTQYLGSGELVTDGADRVWLLTTGSWKMFPVAPAQQFRNPIVRVRYAASASGNATIALRRTRNGSDDVRYEARIGPGTADIVVARPSGSKDATNLVPRVKLDASYRLDKAHDAVFAAQGDTLTLWIDDQKIVSAKDSTLSSGGLGVPLSNGSCRIKTVEYGELPDEPKPAAYPQPAKWTDATQSLRAYNTGPDGIVAEGEWLHVTRSAGMFNLTPGQQFRNAIVRVRYSGRVDLALRRKSPRATQNDDLRYEAGIGPATANIGMTRPVGSKASNLLTPIVKLAPSYRPEQEHEAVFAAQGSTLTLWIDGEKILAAQDSTLITGELAFLMKNDAQYGNCRVRKVEYGELPDTAPAATPAAPAGGWISLMDKIDPAKDAVKGTWTRVADGMWGEDSNRFGSLQLPYRPPEEYDFRMVFTPKAGSGQAEQILAAGGHQFRWKQAGGYEDHFRAAFDAVGGKKFADSPAYAKLSEPAQLNRRYESIVEVRRDRVTGYVDGKKLVEWLTDYHEMSIAPESAIPDTHALGIGLWSGKITFHEISVREVTGTGKLLRGGSLTPEEADHDTKRWDTPAFRAWVKAVAAMPAEKQVDEVSKKLVELNPGFDGRLTGGNGQDWSMIRNGAVEELKFVTDKVTDISPIRVFQRLKLLRCLPVFPNRSKLSDLSPLQGLSLTHFECTFSDVADLSPLRGMPLKILSCTATSITDLSPLQNMPLGSFDFENTKVSDVSPLKGMPLTKLIFYNTQVSDLSPLQGMNLIEISITPRNMTKGMEVIRQMKSLELIKTGWKDSDKFPPVEFWKKYDGGEFGKPTSATPSEK